ncbi:MAG: GntR family transcriptional regulator [Salinibacterium sp.]|nr:GntR family transcriptional regulator [Salinibacterium sp.]
MSTRRAAPRSGRPTRLHSAVFQPIGDEGRAALVQRRVAEAIMSGVLAAGERLPAETELAAAFGVAPATAREALLALRERGLIVTRRGRSGGSFIADSADPVRFATRTLLDGSRVSLRDAAQHYLALTSACVELAARRADVSEIAMIRTRLERVSDHDLAAWRRAADDAVIEIAALSQSARLTREQMKLQGEFSPLLALVDTDPASRVEGRAHLLEVLRAVGSGDAGGAANALRDSTRFAVDWLIAYREQHIGIISLATTSPERIRP